MLPTETLILPFDGETPAKYSQSGSFVFGSAYARSTDSRKNGDDGEDYLTLRTDGKRFAFALCDGVSQSFFGGLAARFLGNNLLEWFWELDESRPADDLKSTLAMDLVSLTEIATRTIQDFTLPQNIFPMVQAVLEKKRAMGSETTFVAGLLDRSSACSLIAWMGDSQCRLFLSGKELLTPFAGKFITAERWSSQRGPIGELHFVSVEKELFDSLMVYSDGLSTSGLSFHNAEELADRKQAIDHVIAAAALQPASDDISLLEIWIRPPFIGETKQADPLPVDDEYILALTRIETVTHIYKNKTHFLSWDKVDGAENYEIRFCDKDMRTVATILTRAAHWFEPILPGENIAYASIRALFVNIQGDWSDDILMQTPSQPAKETIKIVAAEPLRTTAEYQLQKPEIKPAETHPAQARAAAKSGLIPAPVKQKNNSAIRAISDIFENLFGKKD